MTIARPVPRRYRSAGLIVLGRSAGTAGFQVGEDRHHAPVRHVLVDQPQLLEHRADVLLHGPLAHEQGRGDGGVVATGRHRLEDLALPVGEAGKRPVAGALARHQRLHDLRVEHRATAAHLAQRPDQLVDVADPLLEQVAQAGHAVDQQLEGVVLLDVLRQHHHPDPGMLRADALGRLDAFVGVRRGHPDVGQHGVRRGLLHRLDQRRRVGRHRHHLDLLDLGQERGKPFTDQEVVIGDDEAQRHSYDSNLHDPPGEVVLTRTTVGC